MPGLWAVDNYTMKSSRTPFMEALDRLSSHLPGWMLMISGMALLAMAILIPAWLEARELNWQRSVMRMQVETLHEQQAEYEHFYEELKADNPVVLQRVAFIMLRLKPVDATAIGAVSRGPEGMTIELADDPAQYHACEQLIYSVLDRPNSASIEPLLHKPLPIEGQDYQPLKPIRSRVVAIVTGPMRMAFAGIAALCIAASFVLPGCRA